MAPSPSFGRRGTVPLSTITASLPFKEPDAATEPAAATEPRAPTPERIAWSRLPPELAEFLPETMEAEIARLSGAAQSAFVRRFEARRKTLLGAYLRLPLMSHYGYLGRWDVSAAMFVVTLLTLGAAGSVWMAVDFMRMPTLVRGYNTRLAYEILQEVKTSSIALEGHRFFQAEP
jgi:hypothetical protein